MSELTQSETDTLKELIQRAELVGVQFHELSAKIREGPVETDQERSEEANVQMGYQTRIDDGGFGVRANVELTSPSGEARAVVAADYKLTDGEPPSADTLDLFATEVGIMTLFPYLREGISNATTRVFGNPFWLPVLQRGQVRSAREEPQTPPE